MACSLSQGGEVAQIPWPSDMECLFPEEERPNTPEGIGWLTFIDPEEGVRTSLPVTIGKSREIPGLYPVWHIEIGDGWVETSPSIHVPGAYHSPVKVRWQIVEKLGDE